MGLGPSIKMTSLHHYNCPITRRLINDTDVDFVGIIENGVSENFDYKVATATATGEMAEKLNLDGAIVAIDGWGNHHIDFVNVIEQLGLRDIPSVGLSYIGLQGRLVATNPYVETIIDFNKESSGYESCVVGQNNLSDIDAYKAIQILKRKVSKSFSFRNRSFQNEYSGKITNSLKREYITISNARFDMHTSIIGEELSLNSDIINTLVALEPRIKECTIRFIKPTENKHFFVNSNLDFMPIACKAEGTIGTGSTRQLEGISVMLTGVEDGSGFQPANIGSSEGMLDEQVCFDRAGTPKSTDIIMHFDFIFEEGEGRTAEGIYAAHAMADNVLNEIRSVMNSADISHSEDFFMIERASKMRVGLVKICSGLGNMYDTMVFPNQPAGVLGAYMTRDKDNPPIFMTPCEVLDGAIHSLL
ncbi:glycine/sarcosine/betaine reductase component B subunit [Mogibacterium diversum]